MVILKNLIFPDRSNKQNCKILEVKRASNVIIQEKNAELFCQMENPGAKIFQSDREKKNLENSDFFKSAKKKLKNVKLTKF